MKLAGSPILKRHMDGGIEYVDGFTTQPLPNSQNQINTPGCYFRPTPKRRAGAERFEVGRDQAAAFAQN